MKRLPVQLFFAFCCAIAAVLAACGGKGASTSVIPSGNAAKANTPARSAFARTIAEKHFADEGPMDPNGNVHLLISLAHRNQAQLDQLIKDQETPGSSEYLHFLTPQQFDEQFGALPETRNRIKAALRAAGFQVDPDRFGASVVEADGPASKAEAWFSVKLEAVREGSGRLAHMPTGDPVTPSALQNDVVSILGLDSTDLVTYMLPQTVAGSNVSPMTCPLITGTTCGTPIPKPTPSLTPRPTPAPTPVPGSQYPSVGPCQPLTVPSQNGYYQDDTTYNLNPGWGYATYTYAYDYDMPVQRGFCGSAQFPVGIIAEADVNDSDLSQYYADMQINRTGHLYRVGAGGTAYDWHVEATLDVETITGLAPGADVYLYMYTSVAPADMTANMNAVVTQDKVAVVSMSIAACENQGGTSYYEAASGEDDAASQGSAEGITFVAATGDKGGPSYDSGCGSINAPAASSYVTAVGGTSPDAPNNNMTQGSAGVPTAAYRPGYQYAWGQPFTGGSACSPNFCGSGGGASTHFQTPEQLNACSSNSTTWRCVPDVSFAADVYHQGFLFLDGTAEAGANGTSFATPIFAAIQAEIDQRQNTRKGNIVGRLYSLWRTYGYSPFASGQPAIFQDLTAGNNGYQATTGYDWASGIGSVDGWALSSTE